MLLHHFINVKCKNSTIDRMRADVFSGNVMNKYLYVAETYASLGRVQRMMDDWTLIKSVGLYGTYFTDFKDKFQNEDFCDMAMKEVPSLAISYIPVFRRTNKMYQEAAKRDELNVWNIPSEFVTEEICKIIVEHNGTKISQIPSQYHTEEMNLIAVNQNGLALENISKANRTRQICKQAVQQNGMALVFCTNKYKTEEICFGRS